MAHPREDPLFARRALADALADFLDPDSVVQAVRLWSGEFEGRGSLFVGLNRYCRQVAQAFELKGQEAELHLRIFRALQSDGTSLPGDPLSTSTDRGAAKASHAGSKHRACVIEVFFDAIEACVARDPATRGLRRLLLEHARSLPASQRAPVVAWWSGASVGLLGDWPAGGGGTRLINLIYVALAECLGPARADQVFTEAVGQLERSQRSPDRDIRRYL